MESGNVAAPRQGVLVPVSDSSDVFESSILTHLQSAYLHDESRQSFRYKSAVLLKNAVLEEKYNAFRAKKKRQGYSDEELEETYGFLCFDDINKARALGETGVLTGNSSCTTLGDPSKGVYLSMFSDCLDPDHWYLRKSGYIAIIRLTKGRLKKVSQNYTQNLTKPTVGFDCHVSKELVSVSAKTRPSLAFDTSTQYYIYELVGDGSLETAQSPSAVCPFALVSFSYMDSKDTQEAPPNEGCGNKSGFCYQSWTGQLQIGPQVYAVGLKSIGGALIPTKLPPVIKLDKAISILDLIPLLPKAAFLTGFSSEVCLGGLYLSVYELVLLEAEKAESFSRFLQELKKIHLALPVPLIDGGFLILLHSSNFHTYQDTGSDASEFLQAMFVFPDSRTIDTGTKSGPRKAAVSSEILQALPMLHYAEGEVEKTNMDSSEELNEVLMKHMQDYALQTRAGTQSSSSREDGVYPDRYNELPNHKLPYSSPEWTNKAWQSLKSYLSKPVSFELPLSKASEILADEHDVQEEDPVDVNVSSSLEEASDSRGEQLTTAKEPVTVLPSVDSVTTNAGVHEQLLPLLVDSDCTNLYTNSEQTDDTGAEIPLIPTASDDLSAELIVRITSAEETVPDGSSNSITVPKDDDFPTSEFPQTKLQTAEVNHLQTVERNGTDTPDVNNVTDAKLSELCGGHSNERKNATDTSKDKVYVSCNGEQAEKSPGHLKPNSPSSTTWRKFRKRKSMFEKLASKRKKMSASVDVTAAGNKQTDSGIHNLGHETLFLRKRSECGDLKPIVSECGRILVPHGSAVDVADQILCLKYQPESKCIPEETVVETATLGVVRLQQESSTVATANGTESASSKNEVCPPADGAGPLNKENKVVTQPDIGSSIFNSEHEESSTKVVKDEVKDKDTGVLSKRRVAINGNILLDKLKAVLSEGRRRNNAKTKASADTENNTQPCLKKSRADGKTETPGGNNSTMEQDRVIHSVDPLFAHALGLTPTEKPDNGQMLEGQECQQSRDSPGLKAKTIANKHLEILLKPQRDLHKRTKIKTRRKLRRLSAECLKKTWWLHVKTPAGFQSKNCSQEDSVGDTSVVKTVDGENNKAGSPAHALNLLADLALSAGSDPIYPSPRPGAKSVKSYHHSKEVSMDQHSSVLHALLRIPAKAIPIPDSSSHVLENTECVAILAREHNYSSPQCSALLTESPFQVSPLSGSTSLMHRHQQLHSNKHEKLNSSVGQEDRHQHDYCYNSPEKPKFRIFRSFAKKGETVQVTREWKNYYNFKGDWQLSSDAKSKSIMRGLHGPCHFSFKDAVKDVRLIVNMWIGLFYSRSMPRIFHMDCDIANQTPGEGALEMSNEILPGPDKSELHTNAFDASLKSQDLGSETGNNLISKASYPDTKDQSGLDQRSEVLDLSQKDCSRFMKTPDPVIEEENLTASAETNANSTDNINEMNNIKSCCEETETETSTPSQNPASLELSGLSSLEGSFVPTETFPIPSGTGHVEGECNKETCDVGNSPTMRLVREPQKQSSAFPKDIEFNVVAVETDPTVGLTDEIQQKDEKNFALQKTISEPSPEEIMSYDCFTHGDDNCKDVENEKSEQQEAALVPPEKISEDKGVCSEYAPEQGEGGDLKEDKRDENQGLISVKEMENNEPLPEAVNEESSGVVIPKKGAYKNSPLRDNKDSNLGDTTAIDECAISKELRPEAEAHNPLEGTSVSTTTKVDDRSEQETTTHVQCDSPRAANTCVDPLVQDVPEMVSNLNETNEALRKGPCPDEDAIPFPGTAVACLQEKIQGAREIRGIRGEHCGGQIPFTKLEEVSPLAIFGNELDDRCPTPTLDEPSESVPVSVSDNCTTTNVGKPPTHLGSSLTATKDSEPKLCPKSGEHLNDRSALDLKERTLRVLQCLEKFLPKSNYINSSQQTKTADSKGCLDQNPYLKFKPTGIKQKSIQNQKLKSFKGVAPASASHKKHKLPDDHFHALPFKGKLEEAKFHTGKSDVSLQTDGSRIDEEPAPHSVEPSSSPDDGEIQQFSNNKATNLSCPRATTMSSGETERGLGQIGASGHDELESYVNQLLNINDCNSHLDDTRFALKDHLYQCPERNTPGKTPKENAESNQRNCSEALIAFENIDDIILAEALTEEPQTSLVCTVFNTGRRIPCSFLEHVSQRCIPSNPTQASMEQESLIFSEEMKQLFKRFTRGASSHEGTQTMGLSCTGPMTVNFSSLEERDDSLELLDAPSLAGTKIKVDTSDREDSLASTRRENACSQKTSCGQESSNACETVSDVTAKYAKLYKDMMDEACHPTKSQATPEHLGSSPDRTEASGAVDVCDQIKQDMEKMFQTRLNSIVRKSCKTKYRFYILVTSDDDIFEETKTQLEAVGHTAVQPSEFFLHQNSSSPLLIILRNEDIADHISKVPHLLELKKTSCVQFAGIDEPDDVVNLTHQELFTRGGFVMFDRAALENLTLCNMKKCSEILHDLRKTGKWKWIYHYRDSRRLKENARMSAEAKQKKSFLNVCEDEGILEVLPYHDCDVTSRDQSDYLTCLVRLQVHNISARYPVFISDATTDGAFGRNGIFTLTVDYFLTNFSSETFYSDLEKSKR